MSHAAEPASPPPTALLGGADPGDLADRFGTPYFAYDLDVVTHQVRALRALLPRAFELAFAVKANPLLAVLRHLAGLDVGADVASGGELRHVMRAGVPAERIVFTGPGKTDAELTAAVAAGVRVVTVESRDELRRLAAIAGAAGRRQPVLLRLAAAEASRHERARIIGDGGAGKFGMDLAEVRAAAAEAAESPFLEPLGIHAFGASNLLDADALADHVEATIANAIEVADGAGFTLRLVDVGGGLGIPYADGETPLDLAALGARLAAVAARLLADPATADVRVLLEPGRFLVGPAGAYVTRVIDRKRVAGAEVAILDGGIHHLARPALVRQEHRVVAVTGRAAGERATPGVSVTLAGPLCTGLDILARSSGLGALEAGDLVAVLDAGAYGATESMPFFLSHPLPAEIAIRGGRPSLARPRIDPEAWLGWHLDLPEAARDDAEG